MQSLFFAGGGRLLSYLDLIYVVEQQARVGFDALPGLANLETLGRIDRLFRARYSIEFADDHVREEIHFFKAHKYNSIVEWRPELVVKNKYALNQAMCQSWFYEIHSGRSIFNA